MNVDRLLNILVTVTLIEMMLAIGLDVAFDDLVRIARDGRLVTRTMLANYVFLPVATVGLLFVFYAQPMVAAGFIILSVCPGAPYGPPCTALARGNTTVAVALMVILAGSSALIAPALLQVLLPFVAKDRPLTIDATRIVATLLMTQLVPMCVGVAVRQWCPRLARVLVPPARLLSPRRWPTVCLRCWERCCWQSSGRGAGPPRRLRR